MPFVSEGIAWVRNADGRAATNGQCADEIERLQGRLSVLTTALRKVSKGSAVEMTPRQRYLIRGRLLPLSENGVFQVGLGESVNIHEATHEVYLVESPARRDSPESP
jgi:hypothetical protein